MTAKISQPICHACYSVGLAELLHELKSPDGHYVVCSNCLIALVGLALTPEQFFNMLSAGHTTEEFFLHDDFYDELGRALQPSFEQTRSR